MKLIGLGDVGYNILSLFKDNKALSCVLFDDKKREDMKTVKISPGKDGKFKHEQYDSLKVAQTHFKQFSGHEIIFVVSGGSDISGASMRLLERLKGNEITVVYIRPDLDNLTNIERLQEKVTFGVLQEYARSAMLKQIILFDNAHIAEKVQDISINNYYNTINQYIFYNLNSFLFCESISPVWGKKRDFEELNRIMTFAFLQDGEENLLFPLTNEEEGTIYPLSKAYYYLVTPDKLQDESLIRDIKEEIERINGKHIEVNHGVFEAQLNNIDMYKLVVLSTSLVQNTIT